jgi:hypothetical protein
MNCSDYIVNIFVDGVPLDSKDVGCKGESHLFTTETTLPSPVSYKWTLDNSPIALSTESSYSYLFDDKLHYLKLWATTPGCQILKTIKVEGRKCTLCKTECLTQTASIPAGTLNTITDELGKKYYVADGVVAECKKGGNIMQARAVKKAIQAVTNCDLRAMNVSIYYSNPNGRNCLNLTITNSPIRFKNVQVDNTKYGFDTSRC